MTMNPIDKLESLGIRPIYGQYYPLEAADVSLLRTILGAPIPPDLEVLISSYGCAYFPGHKVVVECLESPPPAVSDTNFLLISSLFGGGTQKHRLTQQLQLYHGRIPKNMIPIASDYNGNLFCLSIMGADAGKVFFWDASREPVPEDYIEEGVPIPDDLEYSNVLLVADSVHDFLNRLHSQDIE
jgi:hypothetical protein